MRQALHDCSHAGAMAAFDYVVRLLRPKYRRDEAATRSLFDVLYNAMAGAIQSYDMLSTGHRFQQVPSPN